MPASRSLVDVNDIAMDIAAEVYSGQKMKRIFIAATLGLLPMIISGCAAIEARERGTAGEPYVGVRADAYGVAHPSQTDNVFLPPMCALDMPFSFVVDTICLPYDLSQADKSKPFDPYHPAK